MNKQHETTQTSQGPHGPAIGQARQVLDSIMSNWGQSAPGAATCEGPGPIAEPVRAPVPSTAEAKQAPVPRPTLIVRIMPPADSQLACRHHECERMVFMNTGREFFICRACKLGWYGRTLW